MDQVAVVELVRGSVAWNQALAWAALHFDRSLLFLGDAGAPLAQRARFWSAAVHGVVRGVAVRFEGESAPIVSAAGDDAACPALIAAAAKPAGALLATHETQWLPLQYTSEPAGYRYWLDAASRRAPPYARVHPVGDPLELATFQLEHGLPHWHAEMLQYGHCFGVRDRAGALVSVGGVDFMVSQSSYAQLGGLATAKSARGRGYRSSVIEAIRSSLADAGIARCGLFVDAQDMTQRGFYAVRGFELRGKFRFSPL